MKNNDKKEYNKMRLSGDCKIDNRCKAEVEPKREVIASQLICMLEDVSRYSENVLERSEMRLRPIQLIMTGKEPDEPPKALETWPSLFDEIRNHLMRINYNLQCIDDNIKKTEI